MLRTFQMYLFSRMDPAEEGDFVELDEGDNEAPMDSDGDDFEETEEERQMQFEELDENGNFLKNLVILSQIINSKL